MMIRNDERGVLFLSDIAKVNFGLADATGVFSENGGQSIAISVQSSNNANVIEVIATLRETMELIDRNVLQPAGLKSEIVYDESIYVSDSITLVVGNLLMGIVIAVGILFFFFRDVRTTLIIAICIPLTLILTVILLNQFGRTLNVISLAGLAFAAGLSLDAGIVVLENIYRSIKESTKGLTETILTATLEVRGALIASSITTVAVFLPIVFIKDVSAQLFADLAIALSCAVVVSVLVAFFVVPSLTLIFGVGRGQNSVEPFSGLWQTLSSSLVRIGDRQPLRSRILVACILIPIGGSVLLLPDADYLPNGRQNQLYAYIVPPPGLSQETARNEITNVIDQRLIPMLEENHPLSIENYWLGFFGNSGFLGATARDPDNLDNIISKINTEVLKGFPDTYSGASRTSIFSRFGAGRFIDVNVKAQTFDDLLIAANRIQTVLKIAFPEGNIRALPGLTISEPEVTLQPNWQNMASSGLNRTDLADIVRAYGDGLWVGEFFDGVSLIDVVARVTDWHTPEELAGLPVYTNNDGTVPLGYLVDHERGVGPSLIRRIDGERTISLRFTPPQGVEIETIMNEIDGVLTSKKDQLISDGVSYELKGTAESLRQMLKQFLAVALFAVLVLFFALTALFSSFRDAFLVVFTIPLASVGGLMMLKIVNIFTFQPMDLLTIIGFIVVFGLAVNNAILLIAQYRNNRANGLLSRESVEAALRTRLRPITMTMSTTAFGLVPLIIIPGAGSELYRGLASVIFGGILVNTILTILFVPLVLRMDDDGFESSRVKD
jgi:multidrug efflux pump subunit AcrB